jgi:ribosomal protein S18 acetylase RimI-like enzyme
VDYSVVPFDNGKHRDQVVRLWGRVFAYDAPHNNPQIIIDKKLEAADDLFLVAVTGGSVIGTIMAGYDGHRGWIYSMAVSPEHRKKGIGSWLLSVAERRLVSRGCVKINLQILSDNDEVQAFYEANGYCIEDRISMGKRFPENVPGSHTVDTAD